MKIRSLTICDWHEIGRTDTVVERPSWAQVESAIRAMNNRNLTDVHLDLEIHARDVRIRTRVMNGVRFFGRRTATLWTSEPTISENDAFESGV